MHDMLLDNIAFLNQYDFTGHSPYQFRDWLNEETDRFYKHVSDAETPLYTGGTTLWSYLLL